MNGITYYRLKSDYPGDYTKNCALNGTEVDNNFYVLEGRDVKAIAVNGKDIVITLMNGDNLTACGVLDFVKTNDVKNSVVDVKFDKLNGVLKLTTADGTIQHIEGFATNENTNFSVSTDSTIFGDGLRNAPLGVAPSARTGQYKPVKAIINVAEGGVLPTCGNLPGDRYVTCEDISDYGYLYDYKAVREIACELRESEWRIPTKEDWDGLLNAIEPCECDKTHDKSDKNKFLGKWAGKLLKSKTMWRDCDCSDCGCGCDCDCDEHHHHHHHDHCGHDCDCGDNVCFDYSDDPCVQTNESETNCKCEHDCHGEHRGLDAYGFRITPAGYADDGCNFAYFKERTAFWTATTDQNNTKAYIKRFQYNKDGVYQDVIASTYHLSLRLVKDYNGKNYHEVEEIMDMEYPTLLLPSSKKGNLIWTSCNFASANASLCPMFPNNGQGLTFTRHYYINEWNGFKWVRNEIKQGESVTVEKAPKGNKMVEYRVVGNEFISVNNMIFKDVIEEVKPIIKDVEDKLTERIELVEQSVVAERERAEQVEAELWEGIAKEAQAREEVDNQQWEAINNEATIREQIDNQQWEAINNETTIREQIDNQQWEAINNEATIREEEDHKLYDAIALESQRREEVDNQLWEAINNETTIREEEDHKIYEALKNETQQREENDNQQWEAINTERDERIAKDEEIEGKLLTQEGTEFDSEEGILTLKSADGTNDIKVQFSFNFGTF